VCGNLHGIYIVFCSVHYSPVIFQLCVIRSLLVAAHCSPLSCVSHGLFPCGCFICTAVFLSCSSHWRWALSLGSGFGVTSMKGIGKGWGGGGVMAGGVLAGH